MHLYLVSSPINSCICKISSHSIQSDARRLPDTAISISRCVGVDCIPHISIKANATFHTLNHIWIHNRILTMYFLYVLLVQPTVWTKMLNLHGFTTFKKKRRKKSFFNININGSVPVKREKKWLLFINITNWS